MGIKYLWDTNIAIYYLQQKFPPKTEKFIDDALVESEPAISVITEIELLCWKTATEKDLNVLYNFINLIKFFQLEKDIKLQTAEIRKSSRIKLPDAIIAATALCFDLTLLTNNTGDFKKIEGLKLINPLD